MKKFSSITRVNSHRISRNKKIQRILITGAVVVALLLAVPSVFSFGASLLMSPVNLFKTWLVESQSSFPQFLRDRTALIEELNALESKYRSLSGERFTIEMLSRENKELRSLLSDDGEKRIVAGVIGRPNKLPYDVLVLDKGSDDGILQGAPVFIRDNTVIGIVDKVFFDSSVVELTTTPGFTASVYIAGPDIYTNAEGIGGGQMRVGVPQGIELSVGDLVILPSSDSGVYGSISVVDSVPTRPEQYGYVSPQVPISSLHLVSVGDTPLQSITFEQAQAIVAEIKNTVFEIPVPEDLLITTNGSTTATTTGSTTPARGANDESP